MVNKFLHRGLWIISILFIVFLSIFSLDVFNEYQGLEIFPALFMHLLTPLILLIVVMVAQKWNLVGAVVFFGFAIYYVCAVGLNRHWSWYVAIPGPAAVIGILFLINWMQKNKLKQNNN
jgi:hypothetical protein